MLHSPQVATGQGRSGAGNGSPPSSFYLRDRLVRPPASNSVSIAEFRSTRFIPSFQFSPCCPWAPGRKGLFLRR